MPRNRSADSAAAPGTTPGFATPGPPGHGIPALRTPAGPVPADAPAWNPQRGSAMPAHRYRPVHERVEVPVGDRAWPSARIERAPLWVPVDLRDGNQALAEPMDTPRKRRLFDLLVGMGYKEIEVAYPSASRTDFAFVRHLAESGAVPEDVTVVVFTPARRELIERTFAAVEGLPRTVVHLYTPTAPTWREVVLGRNRAEVRDLVRDAAEQMARLAGARPAADIRFQFSPEVFNLTEPDLVLEICNGLTELWDASPDRPVTHNLPATVEVATPNVYADQIEYLHRHLARRDAVVLSVHPHNDRGTGVACAELAVLAGAQRVEGCLFGNGERTGNVDLVTLALNLYTQGVDPMIDFSDIGTVRRTVEDCIRLPVHPRHPYAGELVHTAFSGTHQDAISKGLVHHARSAAELDLPLSEAPWAVPYLPVDPADLGCSYEAVIRVNSQSGKGGIAHLLQVHHGLDLPPDLRPDFSRTVQRATDDSGREATPEDLWELFRSTYLAPGEDGPLTLASLTASESAPGVHRVVCELGDGAGERVRGRYEGTGGDPLAAFGDAMAAAGYPVAVLARAGHPVGRGPDAGAVAYVRCLLGGDAYWGAGQDTSLLAASARAVLSAVNRASGDRDAVSDRV
ncbi:2-isopropylmalate synthase [Streptomyces angustmyceticus]|uniref:2-isopropylmalate synthase n=1 Tax=Streptomyces angustmyceticus TaxID=285578 RepID=UPI0021AE3B7E|nr:2-isopropylmalate synthase [Streptomyces angustmyceticus]